jgi:hypothetical protein
MARKKVSLPLKAFPVHEGLRGKIHHSFFGEKHFFLHFCVIKKSDLDPDPDPVK